MAFKQALVAKQVQGYSCVERGGDYRKCGDARFISAYDDEDNTWKMNDFHVLQAWNAHVPRFLSFEFLRQDVNQATDFKKAQEA